MLNFYLVLLNMQKNKVGSVKGEFWQNFSRSRETLSNAEHLSVRQFYMSVYLRFPADNCPPTLQDLNFVWLF
jgi:hypothetical protein